MDLTSLPRDSLYEILLHLRGVNLLNFCIVNKSLYHICSDQFWQQKTLFDFGEPIKPLSLSWSHYYIQLSNDDIKEIVVSTTTYLSPFCIATPQIPAHNYTTAIDKIIGRFWIERHDILRSFLLNISDFYQISFLSVKLLSHNSPLLNITDFFNDPKVTDHNYELLDPILLDSVLPPFLWDSITTVLFI